MAPHPRHALPIGQSISGYEIVRMIGQGGFGIVYEATNPVTGERVAIKEFYPSAIATRQEGTIVLNNDREAELYASVLDRFAKTAGAQFQFRHPNILRVFNYVPGQNTGYMITEYIEGESLRGFLQQYGGHFPNEEMFHTTMEQVVGAIGYVHRQGHIHRDIAPDNVMIDRFQKPTVIDFGALKRDLRSSNAYSSIMVLREDYAPPEQQDTALPQGFYTDVFALAGTMYCTLSGAPPLRATTRSFSHTGDPYVPIERASKIACAPEVFEAIDAALRLPAHERPQTIEEFADLMGWSPNYGDAAESQQDRRTARDGGITVVNPDTRPGSSTGARTDDAQRSASGPPTDATLVATTSTDGAARRSRTPAYVGIGALIVLLVGGLWTISPSLRPRQPAPAPVPEPVQPKPVQPEPVQPKPDQANPVPPKPVPPAKLALPDGQYRAVRGYRTPRGALCLARYDIPVVTVRSGRIEFDSDDYAWRGTVDQVTGNINIPNHGITALRTGTASRHGLSITGNYRDATLQSGLCGPGYFRILR